MTNCHCGFNQYGVAFSTASLPISNDLCHCNACRHSSGQLAVVHVRIQGVPLKPTFDGAAELDNLTRYHTSNQATRYFCTICGAHLWWRFEGENPYWCIAIGALEQTKGVVKIGYHGYMGDTLDGGLADHLRQIGGFSLPRYRDGKGSQELPVGWQDIEKNNENRLKVYCHCKAIELSISRPTPESAEPYSPYPDLLMPYDVTHLSKIHNSNDEKWWLRPAGAEAPTKYLAGHCACTSCRTTSGFEIQSWAFIPRGNIINRQTSVPVELKDMKLRPQNLKQYVSSPGRYREFCQTCGATVFWWSEGRPDILDLSVGLVDQEIDGARAENWLDWHRDRVSFSEEALSRETIDGLTAGLKQSKSSER